MFYVSGTSNKNAMLCENYCETGTFNIDRLRRTDAEQSDLQVTLLHRCHKLDVPVMVSLYVLHDRQ